MKVKIYFSLICLVLSILYSSSAFAQYMSTFGFGSRETAMGGAMTAEAEGPSAAFYNPAALAKTKGITMMAGFTYILNDLSLTRLGPTPNGLFRDPFITSADPKDTFGFQLGLAMPLMEGLVLGYALNIPTLGPGVSKIYDVDSSYFLEYDANPKNMETKISLAYSPWPWLSFGAGLGILTNVGGLVENSFPLAAGNPPPDPLGPVEVQQDLKLNWDFAALAGLWVKPLDFLEFGVAWRQKQDLDVNVDLFILSDLNQGSGITQFIPIKLLSSAAFQPQQVALGSTFKPNSRWTLSADVTWVNWEDYSSPLAELYVGTVGPTFFGGAPQPPGSIRIDTTPVPDLNFRDIFVPRIGTEYRPLEWLKLRGGYYFRQSPVPIQAGITNIADSDTHVFSLGSGFLFDDPLQFVKGKIFFDLVFQLFYLQKETNIKVNQLAINDPRNEGLPGYDESGFLYSFGFTTGINF